MSALDELIEEEYNRLVRIRQVKIRELDQLPKGSLQSKRIGRNEYIYLQWREGSKVRSRYIKKADCEKYYEIQRRKELLKKSILSLDQDMHKLEAIM